jgi:hypothetical protein
MISLPPRHCVYSVIKWPSDSVLVSRYRRASEISRWSWFQTRRVVTINRRNLQPLPGFGP